MYIGLSLSGEFRVAVVAHSVGALIFNPINSVPRKSRGGNGTAMHVGYRYIGLII